MGIVHYTFYRGSPIVIGDRVESGAVLPGHSMRAGMRLIRAGRAVVMPGGATAPSIPFDTTFQPAEGSNPAAWLHALDAEQSLAVAAGEYLADSTLLLDGVAQQTSAPVWITVLEAASAAP